MLAPLPPIGILAVADPLLAAQWHPTKNGSLSPAEVSSGADSKAWWICPACSHEWSAVIRSRARSGVGCPACAGKVVMARNSLAARNPSLAAQWHPVLNGNLSPEQVAFASHKKAWWQCPQVPTHTWEANVGNRHKGRGCPICAHQKATIEHSLGTLHSAIAQGWHPTLNAPLLPSGVLPRSNKRVYWQCPFGHVWLAQINNRVSKGNGCPFCSGRQAPREASLAAMRPGLMLEWDWEANNLDPWALPLYSNRKVHWICLDNSSHKWTATVGHRTAGTGCPRCCTSQHSSLFHRVIATDLTRWFGIPYSSHSYVVPGLCWPHGMPVQPDFMVISPPIKLALEYDGLHHLDAKRTLTDQVKNRMLQQAGFVVVRIRQSPLPHLDPNLDLVWDPHRYKVKQGIQVLRQLVRTHLDQVGRQAYGDAAWESFLAEAQMLNRQETIRLP